MNYAPNRGKPWTLGEDNLLLTKPKILSWRDVAVELGRTVPGCHWRVNQLRSQQREAGQR